MNVSRFIIRIVVMCIFTFSGFSSLADSPGWAPRFVIERLAGNPLITPAMFEEAGLTGRREGGNINGPSLIRVPDWLPPEERADPRAEYYLYFANHAGHYIRLAWAEQIDGPYTLYNPGAGVLSLLHDPSRLHPDTRVDHRIILPIADDMAIEDHIASPDVHVDDESQRIILLFHGMEGSPGEEGRFPYQGPDGETWSRKSPQVTFAAVSRNGLDFNDGILPFRFHQRPYLRAFQINGEWHGSTFTYLWRAPSARNLLAGGDWRRGGQLRPAPGRHTAVRVGEDGVVTVFGSSWGETPEHITCVSVKGVGQVRPREYEQSERFSLITPEKEWEGADLPLVEGERGAIWEPVHQLRDPAYFRDRDGSEYILYSLKGEYGIGIARLIELE